MTKNSIKKLISILLCTITMLMQPTSMLSAKSTDVYTLGDLNGDSRITAVDARLCLRASAELETLSEKQKAAADVLGNGKASAVAARIILQFSAEIISVFPAEQPLSTTVWKEVPISDKKIPVSSSLLPFDLREILLGYDSDFNYQFNTYIFKGTILNYKAYQVSWTNENAEKVGPFEKTIIEVHVDKTYYGNLPIKSDILKIYYPMPLTWEIDGSVGIKKNSEYIFITKVLDENYTSAVKMITPEYKGENEKYADVSLGGTNYRLLPVIDKNVILHSGFFVDNKEVMHKIIPYETINTSGLVHLDHFEIGGYIALSIDDFEIEFPKLIEQLENKYK